MCARVGEGRASEPDPYGWFARFPGGASPLRSRHDGARHRVAALHARGVPAHLYAAHAPYGQHRGEDMTTPRRVASLVSSLTVLAVALSLLALSFQARLAVERSDPNIAAPAAPA